MLCFHAVAIFQFFESSYVTSEDFSTISICLDLVDGLLATNVTIELMLGMADMMSTRKAQFEYVLSSSAYINHSIVEFFQVIGGSKSGKEAFTISKTFACLRVQI